VLWPPPDSALAALLAAEASTGLDLAQLWGPILGVVGVSVAGVLTLVGTFRTSGRAAQTQRDMQLDERADKQAARLEEENGKLRQLCETRTEERDDFRERWTRLRVAVIAAGFDPDDMIKPKKGGTDAPH
jgi:hypothetical protein